MTLRGISIVLLACVAVAADGQEPAVDWRVVGVSDGDTLTALDAANAQHKVRLQGIDAPESGQPFGTQARDRLAELTLRRTVRVILGGRDRYGRDLASVAVDGRDVARDMVAAGLAWQYDRYDSSPELARAEQEARAARRGLWADAAPVPPWEWRATERDRKDAPRGQQSGRGQAFR